MAKEIERRWVVKEALADKLFLASEAIRVEQGYLTGPHMGEGVPAIRVRVVDNEFVVITAKTGQGLVREESEVESDDVEGARAVLKACGNHIVIKDRCMAPMGGVCIDHFISVRGQHVDFYIMEIEFPTEQEAAEFIPPPEYAVDLIEITDRNDLSNVSMAFASHLPLIPTK